MHSTLMTAGAGLIGRSLVHEWRSARADDRSVVLDAMTHAANKASIDKTWTDKTCGLRIAI